MKLLPAFLAALAFASALPVVAADEKPAAATPAPAPTPAPDKVFLATELEALKPFVGQKVTVEGTLVRTGESKTQTVRYLNFTQNFRDSVALVFFVSKGGETFSKEKLTEWLGKTVRATGKLSEFEYRLQIEVEKWEQVQEVKDAAPTAEPAKAP